MTDLAIARERIKHVIVLVLENRSFDHMFGFLDHPKLEYPRLASEEPFSALVDPADPGSSKHFVTPDAKYVLPVDPDHSHVGALLQISGGWIKSYREKAGAKAIQEATRAGYDLGSLVMSCMLPEKISALSTLAKEFAICTGWYSSVPGETWPNRNFLHAATSDESVNIELGLYLDSTIFEVLETAFEKEHGPEVERPWRIYHDGPAEALAFRNLWSISRIKNWDKVERFAKHVERDTLAHYSFIEPNHAFPVLKWWTNSSSQHPNNNRVDPADFLNPNAENKGHDFLRGERLVARIYEALRSNERVFNKTLLLITYDEHGGLYDREIPPETVPPGDIHNPGFLRSIIRQIVDRRVKFDFRRLGVRVPAVVVSPWIDRGTIASERYDHASVPATVRRLFAPDAAPLSNREKKARSFGELVAKRDAPRPLNDLPDLHSIATGRAVPEELMEPPSREPDDFSRALLALGLIVDEYLDEPVDAPIDRTTRDYLIPVVADSAEVGRRVDVAMQRFEERARSFDGD